ncbi:hypothetical protein Tco_0139850 [Tanacetum coccineum]
MLWEWRGIANMDFIQLGGSSRVGEMILARERSGFAGEKSGSDMGCFVFIRRNKFRVPRMTPTDDTDKSLDCGLRLFYPYRTTVRHDSAIIPKERMGSRISGVVSKYAASGGDADG